MSDIFISYKREEQATARKLADALESEGWTVWWDPKLRAGEIFDDVIERLLDEAKCVIAMWSKLAIQSEYVKAEATYALEHKKLVPVKIENVNLPFRFKRVHTLSLIGWDGSRDSSEFRRLVEDIASTLGSPVADRRKEQPVGQTSAGRTFESGLKNIARALIEPDIKDSSRRFALQVDAALNQLGLDGLGHSTAVASTLADLWITEVNARLEMIWTAIKRVAVESRVLPSDTLADELTSQFNEYLPLALDETREIMERHVRNAGTGSELFDFNAMTQPPISKIRAEINLFVISLEKNSSHRRQDEGTKVIPKDMGLSVDAERLARLLSGCSVTGCAHDPMLSAEEVLCSFEMAEDEVAMAADELEEQGLVTLHHHFSEGNLGFGRISPTVRFFIKTDAYFKGWHPNQDARVLAITILNKSTDGLAMSEADTMLGWGPRRINPAAYYLSETDQAKCLTSLNSDPYAFSHILVTPKTRRFTST